MRAYWDSFIARWDLNPVVVKELRQAVRSFFVSGVLLLFLFALLIFMLAFLANRSAAAATNQGFGGEAFFILSGILGIASLIFVPAYTGIRIALERQEGNVDLLYTTTLTPGRIIRGKLFSGLYLALLFYSACMPFILLTVFLRGVDLLTIGITFLYLFGLTLLAVQAAILIACLPVSSLFKALVTLPIVGGMISMADGFMRILQFLAQGAAAPSSESLLSSSIMALVIWGWLYVCSVALISPKSMNRALPIRIYSMTVWFLAGLSSFYYSSKLATSEPIQVWIGLTIFLIIMSLLFSVGQPDLLSLRVKSQIPRNRGLRFLSFFFYNGAAQGIAWCLLITLAASPFFAGVTLAGWHGPASSAESDFSSLAVLFYSYSYILTGLFIHRNFFRHRSPIFASLIAILIPLLFATLPALILFFINRLTWQVMEGLQLGNVFNLAFSRDAGHLLTHFYFALGWAILAFMMNLPWFFRQMRAFSPPRSNLPETTSNRF